MFVSIRSSVFCFSDRAASGYSRRWCSAGGRIGNYAGGVAVDRITRERYLRGPVLSRAKAFHEQVPDVEMLHGMPAVGMIDVVIILSMA
jgi:hypothetical protein